MRLFVAVDPPPAQVAAVEAAIGARDDVLRWMPPAQWHITLVFCGDVAASVAADLRERLARAAARTPAFPLQLHGAGTFPRQASRSRVLWLGLHGDTATLTRLAERCAAAARRAGIDVEDRRFRPHLTIARARRDTVDAREHVARLSSYVGDSWDVTQVRLVHSTIGAAVRHETLDEWPLGTTGA